MTINEIISILEELAPPTYQEAYDNCGLLTGNCNWQCTGIICTLDTLENVVEDAIKNKANLIVSHHPIVFKGLKSFTGSNYVERTILAAIKNDIAIYAIHTNLDNVLTGVNHYIANKLGLLNQTILLPKKELLCKLDTYVPTTHADVVRNALFAVGAGSIGNYNECSFSTTGVGTFKPGQNTTPYIGQPNCGRESVNEIKMEMIFPAFLQSTILNALFKNHPYETVAYEIIKLENKYQEVGSGLIGYLPESLNEKDFLKLVKQTFGVTFLKHTALLGKPIRKVALCGGSGSFLTKNAISCGADAYITSDLKYHEFFDVDNKLLLLDIGHWESEQFTIDLLYEYLRKFFPTFAVLKTAVNTNPVRYF